MVKCPRGTPSQIKANLDYINRPSSLSKISDPLKGQTEAENEILIGESEGSDLDSVRADKRNPPTAQDELVYFFINCFLDILLESWEGKPCMKAKLKRYSNHQYSEELGEDLGPCEPSIVTSATDYLVDLYQKRSSTLSKEKPKKDSESNESEYLNEEDFDESVPPDKPLTDEDVHFVFLNGVWYKGRVSRRLMDGEGYYFWEDGTTYQGEFEGGCVTGRGRMEFPDLSTYEGAVYKAFRHGEGMFCFADSPVMYSGQWWLGKKHGHGLIVYNNPSEGHNFYRGQWVDGVKEGFGFRQYPSGAKYIGFWSNGKRHGKGIMFWSNNDIYRGQWIEGLMHGYGEYMWNSFVNKSLSYPAGNTYRGFWEKGKRNGQGLLELKNGGLIETIWIDNLKEGPGAVICGNGIIATSEYLFMRDKPVMLKSNEPTLEESLEKKPSKLEVDVNIKPLSILIGAPIHQLNLCYHTDKLLAQLIVKEMARVEDLNMSSQMISVTPKGSEKGPVMESSEHLNQLKIFNEAQQKEEKYLRNFIILKVSELRKCYDCYAKLACEKTPSFDCVLLRLFLWQMLIDGEVADSNLSLVDVDDILANEEHILLQDSHDPFEKIRFWQFIQILITLSWHLYGQFVLGGRSLVEDEKVKNFLEFCGSCECKSIMKMALEYFIDRHLVWEKYMEESDSSRGQSAKFEESDFAPMEAIYLIYCNVGEPHSARDFVSAICSSSAEEGDRPRIVRYFEKLPFYKVEGKNALTVAGELQHIPKNEGFNTPEIFQLEENQIKPEPKSELTCFKDLKAKRVVRCLMEVCPGMMRDGCIVNMDYKLTFLEFYKALILCTKIQLKMKAIEEMKENIIEDYKIQLEEYKRKLSEFEKLKESAVVSRKRSRQLSDMSKKGKK